MLDTVPPHLLVPLTADSVRWHHHPDDQLDVDALEVVCGFVSGRVEAAWQDLKARAAENRGKDPALHRLVVNVHPEGLDATATGCALSLYVASRGAHDLLHARTGERMTAALSEGAGTPVRVADCSSRLRWTRGIRCYEHSPAPVLPDPEAARVHQARLDDVIEGRRPAGGGRQAASQRLLLALQNRLGIAPGAQWAGHPDGMVTLRCEPHDARRLLALGIPARPRLAGEVGSSVAFTLTERECDTFADTVAAIR
ncbi:hypothetical protein [Streptomyces sp. NPDC058084]|uniref:hypothetical protein n=1 Tax=Streptomyces sp. NPDC058084 TaxID=3346333 RepID=UPI0036F06337